MVPYKALIFQVTDINSARNGNREARLVQYRALKFNGSLVPIVLFTKRLVLSVVKILQVELLPSYCTYICSVSDPSQIQILLTRG